MGLLEMINATITANNARDTYNRLVKELGKKYAGLARRIQYNDAALIGLTVASASQTPDCDFLIRFTDGTYLLTVLQPERYDEAASIACGTLPVPLLDKYGFLQPEESAKLKEAQAKQDAQQKHEANLRLARQALVALGKDRAKELFGEVYND